MPGTFIPEYAIDAKPFNPGRQPWRPTPPPDAGQRRLLEVLRRVTPPDFVLGEGAQSDGLTFIHKRCGEVDVYFVCNLQPNRLETEVTFRVTGKLPQRWDAIAGGIETVRDYRAAAGGTTVPLAFEPWESAIFVFAPPSSGNIAKPQADKDEAEKGVRNHLPERPSGCYAQMVPDTFFHAHDGGRIANATRSSFPVNGAWRMTLEGFAFETYRAEVRTLASWTDSPRTRHFSGTGRYEIEFDLPAGHVPRFLDLGRVGTVAEVELNGQPVGVAWMAPYRLDISKAARPGRNRLVVLVTNTMINYVSGLKAPPEVPPELQPRLGKADEAIYPFSGWARNEMSETDLPPSGLLGPVRVLGNAE